MQGESLVKLIKGEAKEVKTAVFASVRKSNMARTENFKYIIVGKKGYKKEEFYNLLADRAEEKNAIFTPHSKIEHLRTLLQEHIKECRTLYNKIAMPKKYKIQREEYSK